MRSEINEALRERRSMRIFGVKRRNDLRQGRRYFLPVFKDRESLGNLSRGIMETGRQSGRFEGLGDFVHLTDVAPRLWRCDGRGAHAFAFEIRLGNAPLLHERLADTFRSEERRGGEECRSL